jgi:hypothetical protein
MVKEFTLDQLESLLNKHTIENEENFERTIKTWKELYPDQEVPEHLKEGFNLSCALWKIVKEIKEIKCRLS